MSKIKIYHAFPANFNCDETPMSNYTEIAEVDCAQDIVKKVDVFVLLDYAYSKSQNITSSWLENDGVRPLTDNTKIRSTSTGDILEYDGKKYRCEWIGWKEIN